MTKLRDIARNEDGIAMIMAVIILFVLLGIGAALMLTSLSQEHSASSQQGSESAYNLAEAALDAQLTELSLEWPTTKDAPSPSSPSTNYGFPSSCNAASNGTSYCPTASDLSTAYPVSSHTCPSGTPGDAWSSSSSVTNGWTTYVRDAGSSPSLFSDSAEETASPYNSTYNTVTGGSVWVRAVGIVNCHIAVLVTKVVDQISAVTFPKDVINANSYDISNNGNKDIVNTEDTNGNTSQISLRCTGSADGNGAQPPDSSCASVGNSNQVQPTTSYASPPAGSPTLNTAELAEVKQLAVEDGTYFAPGSCPTSASQLTGSPVYLDGTDSEPCNLSITGNGTANSSASPGFLVDVNGTITFGGSMTYYGVIYDPNEGDVTSSPILTLQGTATIVGGVDVDGDASLQVGSSGNGVQSCTDTGGTGADKCGDLEYDAAAFNTLSGFDGAAPASNTFRQLPDNQ